MVFVARQFALGRVGLNKKDKPDDPRWLKVAGGNQDLLTGLRGLLGLA